MAEESKNDKGDIDAKVPTPPSDSELKDEKKKKKKGLFLRVWNSVFRSQGDDFEKRLQHITKEEAAVLSRMKRRSQSSRRMIRNFIILSILFEVIAVGYAIMTTRALELDWRMRALRVLPMFLFPGLSFVIYWAYSNTTKMFDRKDQKTLERLRTERQNKIDELKEKTNYYITQQLIQRYDPDPAAKAAAASVLASKLGSDSGLKVYLGDESRPTGPSGRSSDVEVVPPGGLRNRKQSQTRANRTDTLVPPDHHEDDVLHQAGLEGFDGSLDQHLVVDHQEQPGFSAKDGGWLARMAALLVGEDPTQSYALICGNCHMHNGLARKEDFPYVTYYCPHCSALNRPKQTGDHAGSQSPPVSSLTPTLSEVEVMEKAGGSTVATPAAPVSPATPAAQVTPVTPAAPVDTEARTNEATSDGLSD